VIAIGILVAAAIPCGPQVQLLGSEPELLVEIAGALEARGVRAATHRDPGSTEWGCVELEVALERRGAQIVLSSRDVSGQTRVRSVGGPTIAVALVESWLVPDGGLPGKDAPRWGLAIRAEGASGTDEAWTAGPAITLSRALDTIVHLEVTARLGVGSMLVRRLDEGGAEHEPRVSGELLGGLTLRFPLYWGIGWVGAAGGGRVIAGPRGSIRPLVEPMLGATVPIDRSLEIEIRASAQYLEAEDPFGQLGPQWVFRGGLGARWGFL